MGSVQESEWESLYERIGRTLRRFGNEDAFGKGDYWLVDDNWGNHQQKIEIQNLSLLHPQVIRPLQELLVAFPDWEIVIAVHVRGHEKDWPPMGLTIRNDEIIDGLQRQYLPDELRNYRYAGSRPGSDIEHIMHRDLRYIVGVLMPVAGGGEIVTDDVECECTARPRCALAKDALDRLVLLAGERQSVSTWQRR